MSKVFVNRTLNMKHITHIGFDMDHTLVRYKTENFEALAYEQILDKLIKLKNYPAIIKEKTQFDYSKAIRGLVIDKANGNLLKISRFGEIRLSRHGSKVIDFKEQKNQYKGRYIDLSDEQYDSIDTSFSISFASLFMQLIDLKDTDPSCSSIPDYSVLASDILSALDMSHQDGSIKDVVVNNLDKYIVQEPKLIEDLLKFKKHGKTVFILTNSDYHYTQKLLDYTITPFLPDGQTWKDLFSHTITASKKPRFFYDNLSFFKVDLEKQSLTNIEGPELPPGIYQGGNANAFTSALNLNADEILYVGDHIYGDVVRLKKDCAWRTALVVEELNDEVEQTKNAEPISQEIEAFMEKKLPLEKKIAKLISNQIENDDKSNDTEIKELMKSIKAIDTEIAPLITKYNKSFNRSWGQMMRAGLEESHFATQVQRFACVYVSKLADLLEDSPRTYYRVNKRLMPHEI